MGDAGKALARYRPFLLVVMAIFLIALLLPGRGGSTATENVDAGVGGTQRNQANGSTPGYANATGGGGLAGDAQAAVDGGTAGAVGGTGSIGAAAGTAGAGTGGTRSGTRQTTGGTTVATPGGGASGGGIGSPEALAAPNCDAKTGRVKMPTLYANPCVAPFSGDNGGATYKTGVSKDTITIVQYVGQPDPTTQAVLAAGGDTDNQDQINQQFQEYIALFNKQVELYHRKVVLKVFNGTGKAADDNAGKADAITIATTIKPFMSWGAPNNAYINEINARGILCVCTTTLPKDYYLAHAPYVWGNGLPDQHQAYLMRSEMIGKQMAGAKAKFAGDPLLQAKTRTFGLIYYETTDKAYASGEKFFEEQLATYNVKLTDKAAYIFDTQSAQDQAQTIMSKFASEGITSVIFAGDPIYPVFYTAAATKQNYQPEWIITGSALTDTTFFARTYDKTQWAHAFGLSLLSARGPKNSGDAYTVYKWAYGKEPTAPGSYGVMYPTIFETFIGLSLAGPKLNQNTFRDGMFAFPRSPAKGGITKPLVSFGRGLWAWDDYNLYDDTTEIYWDNTAQGPDELNNNGVGMYRYIAGGRRYLPGQFETTPFKAFEPAGTVLIYDTLPAQDVAPDYPHKDYF